MTLTASEVEEYMSIEKKFLKGNSLELKSHFRLSEKLVCDKYGDIFIIDFRQGTIEISLVTSNLRTTDCTILSRLDLGDKEHKNPDGVKVRGPHVHVYREGYGDKFAYPVSDFFEVEDSMNFPSIIDKYLEYCNIKPIKLIFQWELFK
ncbi:hypothetical protein J4226_01640 [Candidatus Pacearchaeota archaeon]|nr:hypothetical protein [Candidatus Pacearchaeota archaeon]